MQAGSFPERFEHAEPSSIVTVTFGWQMGTWGALIAAAGAALLAYEFRRRAHPTRLCLGQGSVGVYRAGALSCVVGRSEVNPYLLDGTNTVKALFALGMCFVAASALAWAALTMAKDAWSLVLGPAACAAFGSAFASCRRTRLRCAHFMVPKPDGRRECVMVSRQDERRILNP